MGISRIEQAALSAAEPGLPGCPAACWSFRITFEINLRLLMTKGINVSDGIRDGKRRLLGAKATHTLHAPTHRLG